MAQPGCPALVKIFQPTAMKNSRTTAQRIKAPAAKAFAAGLGADAALSDWKNNIASRELIDNLLLQIFRCATNLRQIGPQRQFSFRAAPWPRAPATPDF